MLKSKYGRHLIFLIIIISLIFTLTITSSNAIEINDNNDDNSDVTCNLNDVNLESQKSISITPSGNTFSDIQKAVWNVADGGTVILDKEKYVGDGVAVFINKSVSIVGKEGITPVLDAKNKSPVFGIQEKGTNIIIKNCEFINGYTRANGGAIFIWAQDVEIRDCKFSNNQASAGGAIFTGFDSSKKEADNLKIVNCFFYNNSANVAAGAIGVFGDNTVVDNCTFISNIVYNKANSSVQGHGGAMQIGLGTNKASCNNCLFINNSAISNTPGQFSHGGAGCVREGVSYTNCTFISNSADQGGALVFHSSGEINNCTFLNNTAFHDGGALTTYLASTSWNLLVINSIFEGNKALLGGACLLFGNNIIFDDCFFSDNMAYEKGGAIFTNGKIINLKNSVIKNNIASIGGGVYINSTLVTIQNNEFNYNEAIPEINNLDDGLGGAIYIKSSESTIEYNNFRYNVARNGSAIYIDKSAVITNINNNSMFENQAWVYRLPIYVSRNNILSGQSITINSVIHGGNNIGKYLDLASSNAIYNEASNSTLKMNGINPVLGATDSGILYQDDREYNTNILITVIGEDGTCIYNNTFLSDAYGNAEFTLNDLKVGNYNVIATHFEDNYYKGIVNSTMFTVLPQVDITVTKIKEYPTYNYKDYIMWNLTVKNNGPDKATNIVLRDVLPEGLIFIESNNGEYNPNTGILNISKMDASESISLIIITQINKTGKIVNKANVSSDEYDNDVSNNNDAEVLIVNPSADLKVTVTPNQKNPNFNDIVSWTILATNNGPDNATEVKIFDHLPEGLIYLSDDGNGEYDLSSGVWNLGNLSNGGSKSLTIVCMVNKTGKISNDISINSKEYDWNMSNNNASEYIEISKAANLVVSKKINNSNPNYMDEIKWTITVKNNGPDKATGVILTELMPEGLIILTHNGGNSFDGNVWNIGDLNNGESKELFIYCKVNKTGNLLNFVNISSNEYDQDKSNNNDSVVIHVEPASNLKIIKSVSNNNPILGDVIYWVIKVENNGPDVATDVVVEDIISDGLIYIKNKVSKGTYNENDGLWKIGSIEPFSSEFLEIYCKINKTGIIKNFASVKSNEYDFDESDNKASEFVAVNATADLTTEILVNDSNPNYLDMISLTIIAKNKGPDNATGVVVYNSLPDGLVLLNENQVPDFKNGIWNIGTLKSGEVKHLNLLCRVNKTGDINHNVLISGNELDIDLENNEYSKSMYVKPAANLEISKTASKIEYFPNEVIDYFVNVVNNGPDAAHNVKVNEFFNEGEGFISYSADKGVFYDEGKSWFIDKLENGQSATLTFKVLVNSVGEIFNRVSVSSDEYDYDQDNNFAQSSVLIKNAKDLVKKTSSNKVKNKINAMSAFDHCLELEKTGSPIMILIMAICVLLSFGCGYFQKK